MGQPMAVCTTGWQWTTREGFVRWLARPTDVEWLILTEDLGESLWLEAPVMKKRVA